MVACVTWFVGTSNKCEAWADNGCSYVCVCQVSGGRKTAIHVQPFCTLAVDIKVVHCACVLVCLWCFIAAVLIRSTCPTLSVCYLQQDSGVGSLEDGLVATYGRQHVDRHRVSQLVVIEELPRILIVQLMRFSAHQREGYKLHKHVSFPEKLAFPPALVQGGASVPSSYSLCAVTEHHGRTMSSGHYTSFGRVGNNWYRFDDARVSQVRGQQHSVDCFVSCVPDLPRVHTLIC